MKALHLTNHVGTKGHIENVFKYLNLEDCLISEKFIRDLLYISKIEADQIWEYYKKCLKELDIKYLIFTDTSMMARPFLQNIDDHDYNIIIYITNRFDWGIFNGKDCEYIELYSKLSNNQRVVFCADNDYDQYYAKIHNINFLYEKRICLTPKLCDTIILPISNKYFITDRGTQLKNYTEELDKLGIDYDIFSSKGVKYRDCLHLCEYRSTIHFPYQVNIQSLWENLGYYIIYFIPSKRFLMELLRTQDWYYWEEKNRPEHLEKSVELSEWYKDENACLFEYFDSWHDLKFKTRNFTQEYAEHKKKIIHEIITLRNKESLFKWNTILSEI